MQVILDTPGDIFSILKGAFEVEIWSNLILQALEIGGYLS